MNSRTYVDRSAIGSLLVERKSGEKDEVEEEEGIEIEHFQRIIGVIDHMKPGSQERAEEKAVS